MSVNLKKKHQNRRQLCLSYKKILKPVSYIVFNDEKLYTLEDLEQDQDIHF